MLDPRAHLAMPRLAATAATAASAPLGSTLLPSLSRVFRMRALRLLGRLLLLTRVNGRSDGANVGDGLRGAALAVCDEEALQLRCRDLAVAQRHEQGVTEGSAGRLQCPFRLSSRRSARLGSPGPLQGRQLGLQSRDLWIALVVCACLGRAGCGRARDLRGVEVVEELLHLVRRAVVKAHVQIHAAVSDERRVKLLLEVCG
mmetsp:Transcript_50782/g.162516  ORF Transcript_50782/g.162516 Transcript_50782/m.162516 type:complete len:201 (+) Transcript_50782:215-817(+)